jgi:hypothetical protein
MHSEGGTSFAAPYVAGVAALVRAYYPNLSAEQVADRITATADHPPAGHNDTVGYGVVNPQRAVTAILDDGAAAPRDRDTAIGIPDPAKDSLHDVMVASVWIAAIGLVVTVLILLGGLVARHGRSRGWQPGPTRKAPENGNSRTSHAFTPVMGRSLTISGPAVRRNRGTATVREQTPGGVTRRGAPKVTAPAMARIDGSTRGGQGLPGRVAARAAVSAAERAAPQPPSGAPDRSRT